MFGLGIIGTIIGVYKSIYNPQTKLEKDQALNEERDKNKATIVDHQYNKSENKLLAEKMKWMGESNDKKFAQMTDRIDDAFAIAQNHINTIETEVKALTITVNGMCNNITELKTIINERIPKK
jgi:prophage DNA circulation protein